MKQFSYLLILSFLFFGLATNAQSADDYTPPQLKKAQDNFNVSRARVQTFIEQLHSIDTTYKSGYNLYKSSLKDFRQSKSAFKKLESNYMSQIRPYKKSANSKDKTERDEAREMVRIIKARFQENGEKAADNANFASKEMVRSAKIMKRAKLRRRIILPRLNKGMEQVNKWGLILYEMGMDSLAAPKKTIY